jgi:hypothetical protein
MINAAGHFGTSTATSSGAEQKVLYGEIGNATKLNDVKTGTCHNVQLTFGHGREKVVEEVSVFMTPRTAKLMMLILKAVSGARA